MGSHPTSDTMPRFRSLLIASAFAATGFGAFTAARPAYDGGGWRRDYDALRAAMEARYANLTALAPRVGLPALQARTDSALRAATSDGEARAALVAFIRAFEDGHFQPVPRPTPRAVRWIEEKWNTRGSDPTPTWSAARACGAFGYAERDGDFSVPLEAMGATTPVARDGSFHGAVVALANGRRVGVLRIPLLSPKAYRVECEEAWSAIAPSLAADCADCATRLARETADRLLATLANRVRALRAAGAEALVVDLGGNGGGSEWAERAARVLTDLPVRSARTSLIRGQHTASMLDEWIAELDSARNTTSIAPRARLALDSARARIADLRAEAARPCDLSPIWKGASASCSNLLPATFYTSGLYDHLERGALGDTAVESLLFTPASASHRYGAWHGPLFVLVDGGTASAAEEVTAALRDSRAALVVGSRTGGAGCGYVGRPDSLVLPHSRLAVRMPNCVRLRADGSNEVLGVRPDVEVAWADGDDGTTRARKLGAALAGVLAHSP
jgi:hypothetical protein